MQPDSISIHTVEMLDHGHALMQIGIAIRTTVIEELSDSVAVGLAFDPNGPTPGHSSAQLMQKHAGEFVRYIGLSSPSSGPKLRRWVFHFSPPNNQSVPTSRTFAMAFNS